MSRRTRTPSCRLHKPTGQAVVTLNGKDHYLGRHGTPESKGQYDRLISEWLVCGRQLPPQQSFRTRQVVSIDQEATRQPHSPTQESGPPSEKTVNEVLLAFYRYAQTYYRTKAGNLSPEVDNIRDALRPVRKLYGRTQVREFGALALRAVRNEMISSGLAYTTINNRVHRIRRCFRWAASHELISASIVESLRSVEPLQKGRSAARDPKGIEPVPIEQVEATLPFLSRSVAAMVRIQLLTGCRVSEVLAIRGCVLIRGEPTWEYRPPSHKNAWRGKRRVIPLGPKVQAILQEFLKSDLTAYLFDLRESVRTHHALRSQSRKSRPTPSELNRRCRGKPGQNRSDHYDRRTYRRRLSGPAKKQVSQNGARSSYATQERSWLRLVTVWRELKPS
jgi:integrase